MKSLSEGLDSLFSRYDPDGRHYLFTKVCENWRTIVGDEDADLVSPVERKKNTLILGAHDSIVIQELTFRKDDLLEKVNAYCGKVLFDNLKVELLKGRVPLDASLVQNPVAGLKPQRPARLGSLLGTLPRGSAIARCYAKYVEFFNTTGKL
ncbi:DUF721 domain-containing protein [Desulfonatronospira sp.]|uniref:DUF721 domain-containing protein n=1 Tax=Desulfonatronospira sp. TaxID=1962951 RepID=UPI0025C03AE5|nr:DUF721 domain-containing protein [Desulfonatronospira sp.]